MKIKKTQEKMSVTTGDKMPLKKSKKSKRTPDDGYEADKEKHLSNESAGLSSSKKKRDKLAKQKIESQKDGAKNKKSLDARETCEIFDNDNSHDENNKLKKKKKKCKKRHEEEIKDNVSEGRSSEDNKKKKKKKKKREEADLEAVMVQHEGSLGHEMKKSKKMKNSDDDDVIKMHQKEKKKKGKNKDISEHQITVVVSSSVRIDTESLNAGKVQKKKRKLEKDNSESADEQNTTSAQKVKKKKKRKHGKGNEDAGADVRSSNMMPSEPDTTSEEIKEKKKEKKKKRKLDNEEGSESTNSESKKRKKTEHKDETEKKDGTTELVSQNEIRTAGNGSLSCGTTKSEFGQWGTAQLGSEERQNKFLRLLGGKKSNSSAGGIFAKWSKQGSSPSGVHKITALDKTEETCLNEKLEKQFDKALDYKFNCAKTGGLGFTAPPGDGKKFHIDMNKTKSVKFD